MSIRKGLTRASVIVGGLILVGIGILAFGIRHTASLTRQRDQARILLRLADGVVHDLTTRASSRDLADVRKDLLRAAASYYETLLALPAGDAELSALQARAQCGLGQILAETVSKHDGLMKCDEARESFENLVAAHPHQPEFERGLAMTHGVIARLQSQLELPDEAEASQRLALERWQELARSTRRPDDARALAASLAARGNLLREQGRPDDAGRYYRQAQTLFEELREPTTIDQQRGLAYLETGKLKEAEELFVKGQAFEDLGKLYRDTGRAQLAEKAFRQGIAKAQPALDRLARAKKGLASLLFELGRVKDAEPVFLEAMDLSRRIQEREPDVSEHTLQLAAEWTSLLQLYRGQGRRQEAGLAQARAQPLWNRLATMSIPETELPGAKANRLVIQATALAQLGDPAKATKAFLSAIALVGHQAKAYPDVPSYRQLLANLHANLGLTYLRLQKLKEAEGEFREAATLGEKLVADDPTVVEYALTLAGNRRSLGDLTRDRTKPEAALGWYAKAITGLDEMAKHLPGYVPVRQAQSLALGRRGEFLLGIHRPAESLKDFDRAIALDNPRDRPDFRLSRAACLAYLGDEAQATKEAEVLAKGARTGPELYNLACVWAVSARGVADKKDLPLARRQKLEAEYATKALAMLTRAKTEGYFKQRQAVEHLKKDADLDGLRKREDYRKLAAELDAGAPSGS